MSDQRFDLRLRLLDRQVVDPDGRMVCKVDDIEFRQSPDGSWAVSALLAGPLALGPRLPGVLGRWLTALGRRSDSPKLEPRRIPFEWVTELGSAIILDRSREEAGVAPSEDWWRRHVIERIPGSDHAS
jgi:sporulation protein YlmC with PRC-barrel domain